MIRVFIISLFLSASALAHVEVGTYTGVKEDGSVCLMTAGPGFFENNVPHPLNERIPLTVDGQTFVVHHPVVMDSSKGVVSFNHNLFQGVSPTSTGARALEVEMEHSESFEGPRSFTLMEDFWRANKQTSYKCSNIKLTK